VIDRLNNGANVIADRYAAVTVLFSGLVGFTDLSTRMPAEELVAYLNKLFSEFDELCERRSVEKVKTIGDGWWAASPARVRTTPWRSPRWRSIWLRPWSSSGGLRHPAGRCEWECTPDRPWRALSADGSSSTTCGERR